MVGKMILRFIFRTLIILSMATAGMMYFIEFVVLLIIDWAIIIVEINKLPKEKK